MILAPCLDRCDGLWSLSLFSGRTDPVYGQGDRVSIIQHDNLDDLDVVTVIAKVETMMKGACRPYCCDIRLVIALLW